MPTTGMENQPEPRGLRGNPDAAGAAQGAAGASGAGRRRPGS